MSAPPAPPDSAPRPPAPRGYIGRRKVKSPDLAETTFSMSTIEEEMEGVSIRQEVEA